MLLPVSRRRSVRPNLDERSPSAAPLEALVGKRVVLCITGSIAAYKAVHLLRLLMQAGADLQVVATRSALRFVGASTLAGLSGRPVATDMFGSAGEPHVELAGRADLVVVAPASADCLARAWAGRADDLVAALLSCADAPVVAAPAMHPRMFARWNVQRNVSELRERAGWTFAGPVEGPVASGEEGLGRMMEPEGIARTVAAVLGGGRRDWSGRRVLVTAGPTREAIDPVRAITNLSSGKMGFALAEAAAVRGARVTLLSGPVALATPAGVQRVAIESARDLQRALSEQLGEDSTGADAVFMCAAVADYRPASPSREKHKRTDGELSLKLVPNPDLLAELGSRRGPRRQPFLLGFAMETAEGRLLVERARAKLVAKGVDVVVANGVEAALGRDSTEATLVTRTSQREVKGSKRGVADEILDFALQQMGERSVRGESR